MSSSPALSGRSLPPYPESEGEAGSILTIDLDALAGNWRRAAEVSGKAEASAVVKANAYGLGIDRVVGALADAGCRTFFVALPAEGRAVRAVAPDAVIYVLDGAPPGSEPQYLAHDLRPVLNDPAGIRIWADFCRAQGKPLPAAIHLDTGINRLGLSEAELQAVAADTSLFDAFELVLVTSHLACADEPENPMNEAQRTRFDTMRRKLPDAPASLSNSAGMFLGPDYHFDVTRPGICLYGATCFVARPAPFDRVVTLESRILQRRSVLKGETVGYGATFTAPADIRTATIAAGYGDGIHRVLGNRGKAAIAGTRVSYVGRVSMDLLALDVSALDPATLEREEWAELIGPSVSVDEVAEAAGTIGYEVLTSMGSRHFRRYISRHSASPGSSGR